jgi:hypothetical protein
VDRSVAPEEQEFRDFMSKESIQGPLSALRNAGTVCGVCLTRGSEILVNLFPFSEARVGDMAMALDDIQAFFRKNGRSVDQMSFGYDGGCVTLVEDGEFRLIVMHMLADEVDFIAKASRAFLADFQLNLFAEQIAAGNTRLVGIVTESPAPATLMEPEKPKAAEKPAAKRPVLPPAATPNPTPQPKPVPPLAEPVTPTPGDSSSTQTDGETEKSDDDWVPELKELPGLPPTAVRLADHQPDSTLPPPRRPKGRK